MEVAVRILSQALFGAMVAGGCEIFFFRCFDRFGDGKIGAVVGAIASPSCFFLGGRP